MAIPFLLITGKAATPAVSDLREAIRAYLVDRSEITDLVGTRVRFGRFDQDDPRPGITFLCPSNLRGHHLDGCNGAAVARVQFDCWADDPADALACKIALEGVLDGMPRSTLSGIDVVGVLQVGEADLTEDPRDGSGRFLHHIAVDYRFDYRVSIPAFSG
jgi:hypothetical protein